MKADKYAQFFRLTMEMRDAQKAYYRARKAGFSGLLELRTAKNLEGRVDAAIRAEMKEQEFNAAGDLFATAEQ